MAESSGVTMVPLDNAAVSYGFLQGAGWIAEQATKDIKSAHRTGWCIGAFVGTLVGFVAGAAIVAYVTPIPKLDEEGDPIVEEEVPYPEQEG